MRTTADLLTLRLTTTAIGNPDAGALQISGVRSEHVALRFIAVRRPDYRLAVVVSRKVSKSAVVRNRIRRRIYETIRLSRAAAGAPWPYDMILTVFDDSLATMRAEALQAMIESLLKKAKITQHYPSK